MAEAIPVSAAPFLAAIGRLDTHLQVLLPERNSLQKVLAHLEGTTSESLLIEEAFERRRLWQDSGLFYANSGRLLEAIELFSRMNEKISEARVRRQDWLPCGMPLVWISDYYRNLNCPQLAFRYLLLSGISDAIRDGGKVNPNLGFYFRARWLERLSDEEIQRFYADSFTEYQNGGEYKFFPEFILPNVSQRLTPPYPSATELNIFAVNRTYASSILTNIAQRTQPVDGKALETLAGYLLGCIPGFDVTLNVVTGDSQVDALVRNRGPRYDFRDDLGTYFPVECKDWAKPVGSKEVGWFVNKLLTQECKAGILFSSRGITGESAAVSEADVRYAALTLLKAYHRAGRIVIVLSEQDFQAASRGDNFIRLLQNAYEEVRFDIRH
jgi:restriction endonuclease